MKHQQILDKLAVRFLVQALDESFARTMTWGITAKEFSLDLQNQIWQKILSRWNCVLQEKDTKEVSAAYKQKTILAMAVIAHKYGLNIDAILPQALAAIDALNAAVELSDDFERWSPQIKAFLQTPPQPLKRRRSRSNAVRPCLTILLFSACKTSSPFSLGNGFTLPMSTATPASTNAPS